MITAAYDANNLILMGARVPQILQNFQTKSTGQLSIITFAANTLGCVARLFTTMQEGGGSAMMRSYALSEHHCTVCTAVAVTPAAVTAGVIE
jgi:mannose-P-dolichol utilization defect protein 1